MKNTSQRGDLTSQFFDLTDKSVKFRVIWFTISSIAVWLVLSGLTMIPALFGVYEKNHKFIVIIMSLFKYIPMLMLFIYFSKKKASRYLVDVYELPNEKIANKFLEEVIFGSEQEKITIKEGRISKDDENSSVILIGGPGSIQVNLDSVALLEKVNGEPKVIYPQKEPWKLGRFERLREVNKYDEVGNHEYAIINLRDQFISGLTVKSRTKDGISLEACDIKVMFSLLRGSQTRGNKVKGYEYLYDEKAVHALVYNQPVLVHELLAPFGLPFPWNTTVRPLITSEMENLITSHTLSEILVTVKPMEVSNTELDNQASTQLKTDKTIKQTFLDERKETQQQNFETRPKITAQFYDKAFKEKAAEIGISIDWIDVGAWRLPNSLILERHKDAWNLMRDNAKKREQIKHLSKRFEVKEIINLVHQVFSSYYEANKTIYYNSNKENLETEDGQESTVSFQDARKEFDEEMNKKKDPSNITKKLLIAFRKELVAGKMLIKQDTRPMKDKKEELDTIDNALRNIISILAHFTGQS